MKTSIWTNIGALALLIGMASLMASAIAIALWELSRAVVADPWLLMYVALAVALLIFVVMVNDRHLGRK